jgi:hypothetical protein
MDHAAQFLVTKGGSSESESSTGDSSTTDAADISSSASKPATTAVP